MDLRLSDISVQLPGMPRPLFALRSLEIKTGERVLIQGPSGKGKTTLLHLMAGLFKSAGSVKIADQELNLLGEAELARFRRDKVGLIFQKLNLISHLTATENIQLGLGGKNSDAIRVALKQVKLEEFSSVLAQNLSLGQQQRVAVARVLAKNPPLVLADEPTSSLDDENASVVIDTLFRLPATTTVVVVSHDHRLREKFTRVIDFEKVIHA